MKNWNGTILVLTAFTLVVAGCAKKSTEQASITGTGFDSISSTEELAQLPQGSTVSQQGGVEVLPIETSPITQGVPPIAGPRNPSQTAINGSSASDLTRDQQIQTALKNAGLYQGNVDGKLGPASKRAVQAFQQAQGLKVDGKVGPKTWAALEPYLSGAPQTISTEIADQ